MKAQTLLVSSAHDIAFSRHRPQPTESDIFDLLYTFSKLETAAELLPPFLHYLSRNSSFSLLHLIDNLISSKSIPTGFLKAAENICFQKIDQEDFQKEAVGKAYNILSKLAAHQHKPTRAIEIASKSLLVDSTPQNFQQLLKNLLITDFETDSIGAFETMAEEVPVLELFLSRAESQEKRNILYRLQLIHQFGGSSATEKVFIPNIPKALEYKSALAEITEPSVGEKKTINVCMSFDDNYAPHAGVSLATMLYHAHPNTHYNFYVVMDPDTPLSQENQEKFEALKSIKDFSLNFISFPQGLLPEACKLNSEKHRWPKLIYYKLFAPELFPDIDKLLWLDADSLIFQDLQELWNEDLSNNYIAGVPHSKENTIYLFEKMRLDQSKDEDYLVCRAATLLFNLQKMREDNALEFIRSEIDRIKRFNIEWTEEDIFGSAFYNKGNKVGQIDKIWCSVFREFQHSRQRGILQFFYEKPWATDHAQEVWQRSPDKISSLSSKIYWSFRDITPWSGLQLPSIEEISGEFEQAFDNSPLLDPSTAPSIVDNKKFVFLNIPLTMGQKIEKAASIKYDRKYLFPKPGALFDEKWAQRYDFIHIHYPPLNNLPKLVQASELGYNIIVSLKNPLSRISDQLRFLKHWLRSGQKWLDDFPELRDYIRSANLNDTDNIREVFKLYQKHTKYGFKAQFNNAILRHFIKLPDKDEITEKDVDSALRLAAQNLDFIINAETFVEDCGKMCSILQGDFDPAQHIFDEKFEEFSEAEVINYDDNPSLKQLLIDEVKFDLLFYDKLRALKHYQTAIPISVFPSREMMFLLNIPSDSTNLETFLMHHQDVKDRFYLIQDLLRAYLGKVLPITYFEDHCTLQGFTFEHIAS